MKWEGVDGKEGVPGELGMFPHVYGNGSDGELKLGAEEVESVGKWVKGEKGWEVAGWCFEEDKPE